ncbi:hypothetical protein LguiA_007901 [Lonicera macranthoides]
MNRGKPTIRTGNTKFKGALPGLTNKGHIDQLLGTNYPMYYMSTMSLAPMRATNLNKQWATTLNLSQGSNPVCNWGLNPRLYRYSGSNS